MNPYQNKQFFRWVLLALVLVIVLLLVNKVVFGGKTVFQLRQAAPFSGTISQIMAADNNGTVSMPVYGKDYSFNHIYYFDNNDWIYISIKGLRPTIGDATVLLEKQGNGYTVALGPGTAFPRNVTLKLPSDLRQYLDSQGMIYDTE